MRSDGTKDEEGDKLACPACKSHEIEDISGNEKILGLGLFQSHDFIGGLSNMLHNHRCLNCGYAW